MPDEDKSGDEFDLDNLDTTGMTQDELRATVDKLATMCNEQRHTLTQRDEENADDDEDDEKEKREIVSVLFRTLKIDYAQKRALDAGSLADVKAVAEKLSAGPSGKPVKRKIDDNAFTSKFASTKRSDVGATDEEIVQALTELGTKNGWASCSTQNLERLGLTKRSAEGTVWGTWNDSAASVERANPFIKQALAKKGY
jgi:hypothetical protein